MGAHTFEPYVGDVVRLAITGDGDAVVVVQCLLR